MNKLKILAPLDYKDYNLIAVFVLISVQEMVSNYGTTIEPFVELYPEEEPFDISFQKGFH